MGVTRQEYWSGLPFPPLGDLPNSGIKPGEFFTGLVSESPSVVSDSLQPHGL